MEVIMNLKIVFQILISISFRGVIIFQIAEKIQDC